MNQQTTQKKKNDAFACCTVGCTFVLCACVLCAFVFVLLRCSPKPLNPSEYICNEHNIRSPADMTAEHWNNLFANVPKNLRLKIIEKLDTIRQTADDYYRVRGQTEMITQQWNPESQNVWLYNPTSCNYCWLTALSHSSEAMTHYPAVLNTAKKAEYWKESTENLLFCLDDQIEMWRELIEEEKAELLRLQSLDVVATPEEQKRPSQIGFRPFLRSLTEDQKERLRNDEPLFKNPYLGVPSNHYVESVVVSRWSQNNPAQAYLLELRNEELAPFRVNETPELDALDLTVGDLMRWDGSTSLKPLAKIIGVHIAHLSWEWDGPFTRPVGFGEEPPPMPEMPCGVAFLNREASEEVSASMESGGTLARQNSEPLAIENQDEKPDVAFLDQWRFSQTHEAYVNLIEGNRDIVLVSRMPSEDELALIKRKNVELEYHPFAKDAFVFIGNRNNPVRDLTLKQARGIFSGKITRWKQVGGFGAIIPFLRNRNSGSEELMRELVMKDQPVKEGLFYNVVMSMDGIYDLMEKITNGIGYTILYYDRYMVRSPYTRTMRIDGVEPTPQTVADGTYPLLYECVAVVRKDGPEKAKAVAKWLTGDEGAKVVRESGYVPTHSELR